MAGTDLLDAIDKLYASALEPQRWDEALSAVAQALGAVGVSIIPLGTDGVMRALVSESLKEANDQYQQGWWRHDTPSGRMLAYGMRPGMAATDRLVMREDEIRRDPFYQEFLRSHGIQQTMASLVSLGSGRFVAVAAQRGLGCDLYQNADVDALTRLTPHIQRALTLATSMVEARRLADDLSSAIEQLAWGVVLLDMHGAVRTMNGVAREAIGDGLLYAHGRIQAAMPDTDARLQAAIRAALPGGGLQPVSGVLIRRPSGREPFYAEVAPIRPKLDALEVMAFGDGGAMLLIRSLETGARNVSQHLRDMGLTPAEARLAETLGAGASLRVAADVHSIAYETARSHLRSIFQKLGLNRQSELVALMTRLMSLASRGGSAEG